MAITPWNSPLLLAAWKLAPALAAGNTAVLEPSESTSASTLEFVKLIEVAGFPPGVVNVITGFDTEVGPVTTMPQYEKILGYLDVAKGEGAECVLGGSKASRPECGDGWFVEPTIFTGVNNRMRIAQEEVFGPVLSVIPFRDEEQAVEIGNDVVYGLAAGVWTQSIRRAITMSERLQAGTVWVNTYRAVSYMSPFGGYKRSGLGRESGQDAIYEYLQTKSVWLNFAEESANPFVIG